MRKFSIIGHYFITPGRYSCPGVSPARGGWPWNAGNARFPEGPGRAGSLKVGSGSGGFGDGSGNGFESWWLQGWFQGRFPGVGAGWFRAGWVLPRAGSVGGGFRDAFEVGAGAGAGVCVISGVVPGGGEFEDVSGVVPGGCGDGSRGWFRGRVRAWRPAVGRGCAGGMVWGCRERPGEGSIRIFRAGGVP